MNYDLIESTLSEKGYLESQEALEDLQTNALNIYNTHMENIEELRSTLRSKFKSAGATDIQLAWGKVGNVHLGLIRKRACLKIADKIKHEYKQALIAQMVMVIAEKRLREMRNGGTV